MKGGPDRGEEGVNISSLSHVSLFIDENKRWISYGLYGLGIAGLIKIGIKRDITMLIKKFEEKKLYVGLSIILRLRAVERS